MNAFLIFVDIPVHFCETQLHPTNELLIVFITNNNYFWKNSWPKPWDISISDDEKQANQSYTRINWAGRWNMRIGRHSSCFIKEHQLPYYYTPPLLYHSFFSHFQSYLTKILHSTKLVLRFVLILLKEHKTNDKQCYIANRVYK